MDEAVVNITKIEDLILSSVGCARCVKISKFQFLQLNSHCQTLVEYRMIKNFEIFQCLRVVGVTFMF